MARNGEAVLARKATSKEADADNPLDFTDSPPSDSRTIPTVEAAAAVHWLEWCTHRNAQVRWFTRQRNGERRVRVTLANGVTYEGATLAEAAGACEERLNRMVRQTGERVLRRVGGL
jgi:hypothetical protein